MSLVHAGSRIVQALPISGSQGSRLAGRKWRPKSLQVCESNKTQHQSVTETPSSPMDLPSGLPRSPSRRQRVLMRLIDDPGTENVANHLCSRPNQAISSVAVGTCTEHNSFVRLHGQRSPPLVVRLREPSSGQNRLAGAFHAAIAAIWEAEQHQEQDAHSGMAHSSSDASSRPIATTSLAPNEQRGGMPLLLLSPDDAVWAPWSEDNSAGDFDLIGAWEGELDWGLADEWREDPDWLQEVGLDTRRSDRPQGHCRRWTAAQQRSLVQQRVRAKGNDNLVMVDGAGQSRRADDARSSDRPQGPCRRWPAAQRAKRRRANGNDNLGMVNGSRQSRRADGARSSDRPQGPCCRWPAAQQHSHVQRTRAEGNDNLGMANGTGQQPPAVEV